MSLLEEIKAATTPQDLFGTGDAAACYKNLVLQCHPDRNPGSVLAGEAMANLTRLWAEFNKPAPVFTVTTKRGTYTANRLIAKGSIANVYDAGPYVIKVARSPKSSDLMQAEARALRTILSNQEVEDYHPFVPLLVDATRHKDSASGIERRVSVQKRLGGFYTLAEVLEEKGVGHLDPKDAAWIMRRLYVALGTAHTCGVVHGAVTPENVLIHPRLHGLVLAGWTYSVETGQSLKAIPASYTNWYPIDERIKEPATSATDLYLAANLLNHMSNAVLPQQLRAFVKGCTLESARMRPQNAWELRKEFTDLIERLWGKRTFRPFDMSNAPAAGEDNQTTESGN